MALITPQNAVEMAKRSWEARRLREAAQQQAAPEPQEVPESYVDKRLIRVRAQIDMLSDMLESEEDPSKIDRLANAITRLSGLEREYANRPLPGTLKPSSKPAQARHATVQPIGPAPQAVVVPPTEPQP